MEVHPYTLNKVGKDRVPYLLCYKTVIYPCKITANLRISLVYLSHYIGFSLPK